MSPNTIDIRNYWINQRKSKFEQLFEKLDEVKTESRNVLQSSLLLLVSILGITTSFSSQNSSHAIAWKITWSIMILTIIYGTVVLLVEHYIKRKYEFIHGLQQADLAEIEIKYLEGQITQVEKEKLVLAALSLTDPFETRKSRWNKEGKEIIKKYRPRLFWSGKIHKKLLKVSKGYALIYHYFRQTTGLYYLLLFCSFAALGYALLVN
jgi:hypothetical protein